MLIINYVIILTTGSNVRGIVSLVEVVLRNSAEPKLFKVHFSETIVRGSFGRFVKIFLEVRMGGSEIDDVFNIETVIPSRLLLY